MTGLEKLFAVDPLTWTVDPTFTEAPVVVNVATSPAGFVPAGNETAMVLAPSLMVPAVPRMENAVMAFVDFNVVVEEDPEVGELQAHNREPMAKRDRRCFTGDSGASGFPRGAEAGP